MQLFVEIRRNYYFDSIMTLIASAELNSTDKVVAANVAMGTNQSKEYFTSMGLVSPEIDSAGENDLVIAAITESDEHFKKLLDIVDGITNMDDLHCYNSTKYNDIRQAVADNPSANLCSIAVPGEYALVEVKKALELGLHCVVFSNNVPMADEREMKELARQKGLLCMGPDCGVANINGAALVLASINNRGPIGICGASGCGLQYVAAVLHEKGSGVTQVIGTGGMDIKEDIGGISMLMGIDALEDDPATKYIVLISRKPADLVLCRILGRVSSCKKPVIVFFMNANRAQVEASGAIWAENLDDCAQKACGLIGAELSFPTDDEIYALALSATNGMSREQKYVRGAFCGGTFCDEAMNALQRKIGDIRSNCPTIPNLKLVDSTVSVGNCVVDYGEEEFTLGRPHPVIDPSARKPAILKEAGDPETAVLLLDIILAPPGHEDPAGFIINDIKKAMEIVKSRGGRLAVVASVLGTDADFQNVQVQKEQLEHAGVYVCMSNYRAALLAGEIIRIKNEKDGH